jgi:hypothetical protein
MPTWGEISPTTGRPLSTEERFARAHRALRELAFLLECSEMREVREGYPSLYWWILWGLAGAPEQQREVPPEVLNR